jgi:hypothetical protein
MLVLGPEGSTGFMSLLPTREFMFPFNLIAYFNLFFEKM